jgi:hypothetical protein
VPLDSTVRPALLVFSRRHTLLVFSLTGRSYAYDPVGAPDLSSVRRIFLRRFCSLRWLSFAAWYLISAQECTAGSVLARPPHRYSGRVPFHRVVCAKVVPFRPGCFGCCGWSVVPARALARGLFALCLASATSQFSLLFIFLCRFFAPVLLLPPSAQFHSSL